MKRWLRLFGQVASFLLFVAIIWWAGPTAWQEMAQAKPLPLLVALLFFGGAGVFSATRLQRITHSMEQQVIAPWRWFHQANWIARSLGLVLPRNLSAIGGKSVALRARHVPLHRAVWIVLVDNLFDIAVLLIFCVPAFFYLQGMLTPTLLLVCAVGWGLMASVAARWVAQTVQSGPTRQALQRLPWLGKKLAEQETAVLPTPADSAQAVLWTVLLNGVIVSGYFFIAQAVGVPVSWALLLAAYPFVQLSLVAAVTPSGLGIFELGWLGLLALGGVPADEALTFVVAQRAFVTLFVLFWTAVSMAIGLTIEPSAGQDAPEKRQL
jgi:uncharacterized membrane protein YbhN (UPF0104 family)